MENYEERYKKALGRAVAKIDTFNHLGNVSVAKSIEEIFPELAESEDEKIRKALIHLISEQDGFLTAINGISVKDILDWLEKLENLFEPYDWNDYKDKPVELWNAYIHGKAVGLEIGKEAVKNNPQNYGLEKQGERKPAEWSEKDENAIWVIKDIIKHSEKIDKNIYNEGVKNELFDWLKSLQERVCSQLKQEWSEEDENIRRCICMALTDVPEQRFTDFGLTLKDCLDWLDNQSVQRLGIHIPKFHKDDIVISTNNRHLTYRILEVGNINELGNPEYKVEIFKDGKPGIMNEKHNIHNIEISRMDEWGEFVEHKPSELGEEDENNWKEIMSYIKDDALRDWLEKKKEQNHQGKLWIREEEFYNIKDDCFKSGQDSVVENPEEFGLQKSVEWSEEDEKFLERVTESLLFYREDANDEGAKDVVMLIEEEIDWLKSRFKSLRPNHWKPSAVQIEALRKVTYQFGNSCFGETAAKDRNLHSLYTDLEKLLKQ